eukprot:TRINITY_DN11412_c0_g1_i3.p1 TRINITY_DN11412_c0_g1~~TRINITY_DN11412_c0_g1_i3.p1  ORF type:complete len:185 (-),score=54.19 TRINITY_DN11412_c0_g1_i3:26-580(-)
MDDVTQLERNADTKEKTDVYRPPKITPTSLDQDEKKAMRRKERKEKAQSKATRDSALTDLRREVFGMPEIQGVGGGASKLKSMDEKEQEEFEEDQFVRLQGTKEDKKKQKQRMNAFEDFDDFGDVAKTKKKKEGEASELKSKSKKAVKFKDFDIPSDSEGEGQGEIGRAVQQECRDRSRMPSSA